MKKEHYLKAVSAAIEGHETRMGEAFEEYSKALLALGGEEILGPDFHASVFFTTVATSYLNMQDTITNLRKWPLT